MTIVDFRPVARGFSLLELVVVVLLLSIITAAGIQYTTGKIHEARRDEIAKQYVADFRVVARAARAYVNANESGWAVGSNNNIAISTLITDNLLPAGFGTTQAGTNRTPTATLYRIVARKVDADLPAQIIIYETGSAAVKAYLSFGGPKSADRIYSLKSDVARELYAASVPAGVMAASSAAVTGAGTNAWTKSLSAWTGSTLPPEASLAVLLNFPDLEPDVGPPTTVTGGAGSNYGICRFSKQRIGSDGFARPAPGGYGTEPALACGAAYSGFPSMIDVPNEIAVVDTCDGVYNASTNPGPVALQDVGPGSVTFGEEKTVTMPQLGSYWQSQCNGNIYPECQNKDIEIVYGKFTLNDVKQDAQQCNVTYWKRNTYSPYNVYQTTAGGGYGQRLCCENPG